MMTSKMSSREPAKDMLKAFRLMDIDEHGVLGPQDLKRVASLLGESVRTTARPLCARCAQPLPPDTTLRGRGLVSVGDG